MNHEGEIPKTLNKLNSRFDRNTEIDTASLFVMIHDLMQVCEMQLDRINSAGNTEIDMVSLFVMTHGLMQACKMQQEQIIELSKAQTDDQ